MRPIELTPRLLALAHQVPCGARFADVGTDHARLPVWLLEQGIIGHAIATDLREGPLERARQTAARHGLTDCISFRLGDGLHSLAPGEADVYAIAGMGGETISAILSAAPWILKTEGRFLLQPMTSISDLRAWLWRNGFCFEREVLVGEGNAIYVLLTVSPGDMEPLSPAEEWAGRQVRGMESPLRSEYLARIVQRCSSVLDGLKHSKRSEDREQRHEWESLMAGLIELKKEWDIWQT